MLILAKDKKNIKISEDIKEKEKIKIISFEEFDINDLPKDETSCYIFFDGEYFINSIPLYEENEKIISYYFSLGKAYGQNFYLVSIEFLQFVCFVFGKTCIKELHKYIDNVENKVYDKQDIKLNISKKETLKSMIDNYFDKNEKKYPLLSFFLNIIIFCEEDDVLDYCISLIPLYLKEGVDYKKCETFYPLPNISYYTTERIKEKLGYYVGFINV